MGIRAASTRRSAASTAVSGQAVAINSGTGFSVTGSTISGNTSVSLGVVAPGSTSSASFVSVASGPAISGIQYLDVNNNPTSANAVSTSGGNIRINGTGFASGSSVYINNLLVSNTFVSSTQIRATCPAASAGNVTIMVFTPTNVGTFGPNVRYSGVPTWTTAAVSFQNSAVANVALVASSDSTLTYTLQAGSTLPTGISLNSAGYLTGTATGYSTNTTGTVVLIATDLEGQAAQQTINWTVTSNDPQYPYTTLLLSAATTRQTASFVKDNSTNNFPMTVVGDTRAHNYSPYYGNGYYGVSHSATPDYLSVPHNANFSINSGSTDIFIIEGWFYFNAVTANTSLFDKSGINGTSFANWTVFLNASSQITLQWGVSGSPGTSTVGLVASTTVPVVGTWYHIVFVKSNADWAVFANGTRIISYNGLNTANDGNASALKIGYGINSAANSAYFNGYISNVRAWRGTSGAPYSATSSTLTVPTSPLTAISGTTLLTHQSARFVDVSSAAATVTATGANIKVSPAIPFAASSTYATYGSAYFDGTGDYLSVPYTTTNFDWYVGDFTIEAWVYPTSLASGWNYTDTSVIPTLIGNGSASTTSNYWSFGPISTGVVRFYYFNGAQNTVNSTATIIAGQWNHIAMTKTSSGITIFVNGVPNTPTAVSGTPQSGSAYPLTIGMKNTAGIVGYTSDIRIVKGTALYNSNFTPPTAPLTAVANTQLLTLQTNGAHNNSTFSDNSNFNNLIARAGNATNGTFSPYSAMGWSNYFNGTTDYFTTNDPVNSATDVTIEFWVNMTSIPATRAFVVQSVGGTTYALTISASATPTISFWNASFSAAKMTTATTLTLNTWYHIAMTKVSGVISIFVNGVKDANTYTLASTMGGGTTLYVGQYSVSGNQFFPGYISNLRVVNGPVLYTTNFTPSTTPLTAVANTGLLTCQSNRFKDSSTNNYAITLGGTPSVQAFSPFNASGAYSAATNGGSMYFDGTGDYLSTPYNSIYDITASDFTVEAWIYRTASAEQYIVHQRPTVTANGWAFEVYTGNVLRFYYTGGSALIGTVTIPINAWTHVAATRSGTAFKTFVNGVLDINTTISSGTAATGSLYVGTDNTPGSTNMTGYISDLRIIKGTALYTSAFTPPTAPLTPTTSTTFLLSGAAGGVIDSHGTVNLETVGDAKVTTDKYPYATAGQSYYFDGNGDWLSFPGSNIALGVGNFTIEAWIYPTTVDATYRCVFSIGNPVQIYIRNSTVEYYINDSDDTLSYMVNGAFGPASSITANTWTHIALVRNGTTFTAYVNGVAGTAATNVGGTVATTASQGQIGAVTSTYPYTGYIADLRVTKGFARYSANFSVPTSPFLGQ